MVKVEFDVQQRDKYGRLLGYVYLADGRMFNEEIVKAGYASLMAIPPNVKYEGKFLKAYREAREGKKGVVGTEQQEVNMAKYSVYFFCDECCQAHPLGITIELNDGPPDQASIRDTYAGRELPPQVATLIGNMTQCPNTRKMTSQEDNNQVFLVPIG